MKLGKFLILETLPQKTNISLKHSELLKNHKNNLFFVQFKHLKSTFTFLDSPALSSQKVKILIFGLFDKWRWGPFGLFTLLGIFLFDRFSKDMTI